MVQRMKWREGIAKELKLELVWRERNEEIDETWPVKELPNIILERHLDFMSVLLCR
jgi:hypothetical protein